MGKKKSKGSGSSVRMPKTKCCESKSKCGRCPLRMLKEGTLPPVYAVKRRRLVHVRDLQPVTKAELSMMSKKLEKQAKKLVGKSGGKLSKKDLKRLATAA